MLQGEIGADITDKVISRGRFAPNSDIYAGISLTNVSKPFRNMMVEGRRRRVKWALRYPRAGRANTAA